MSVILPDRRVSWLKQSCVGVCLACLLALIGLCRMESAAAADDALPLIAQDNAQTQTLVTEAEKPEEYSKFLEESPYPPTASPQELTLEQIETIAKLAPMASKSGMRTHPAMVPLFRSMALRYTGGSYKDAPLRFRLHVPDNFQEGKKYPLVVWLHGTGECGADNINQLAHLHHMIPSLVGPKKRDFFLLVPQCPHTHSSWEAPEVCATTVREDGSVECHLTDDPVALGDAPISFTIAMIEAVMKEFPVDPNRVSVSGLSSGGDGVWKMLERRPDLFAAAVPIVSWRAMQDKSLRKNPLLKKIPIWAIYSSDDNAIDYARKEFERMRTSGCNVHKTEFGVCGHRAWTPAMLQGDVFGWLVSRAKDGERYYIAEPSPTSPEKIGIFADVTEGDLKREPTKAVRPPAAEAVKPSAIVDAAPPQAIEAAKSVQGWVYAPNSSSTTPDARPIPQSTSGPQAVEESKVAVEERFVPAMPEEDPRYTQPLRAAAHSASQPSVEDIDGLRLQLISRYAEAGNIEKALAVADKVKDRLNLTRYLLSNIVPMNPSDQVFDYVERELDRMDRRTATPRAARPRRVVVGNVIIADTWRAATSPSKEEPLQPIAEGKKSPKDECGKEWAMTTTTEYGLYPNGWDQEAAHVPAYVVNETGRQLRDRLENAFLKDDLPAMKELCDSFIKLDDIPLSSPWFDTSGGRLQGRIKYTLNGKAKPVVELLHKIAGVQAESKKEYVELAKKSLERIEAITHPKDK